MKHDDNSWYCNSVYIVFHLNLNAWEGHETPFLGKWRLTESVFRHLMVTHDTSEIQGDELYESDEDH